MLCLYLEAPFAVCRTFTAGWYRPTATFLTPSAAFGLLLNVAGIESRLREEDPEHDGKTPASLMRHNLPSARLALGVPAGPDGAIFPRVQTIFQQLHNYPVGKDAGIPAELAKGNKNNISPVRREFLSDLRAWICVDGNVDLEDRVRRGLRGHWNEGRYGLPFLGDNQFLIDRLEERSFASSVVWYERITVGSGTSPRPRTTRLTVWIDRADMSKTVSNLYAPTDEPQCEIPGDAWTWIEPT
jgi:CRISPR-associated protein Cas5t